MYLFGDSSFYSFISLGSIKIIKVGFKLNCIKKFTGIIGDILPKVTLLNNEKLY